MELGLSEEFINILNDVYGVDFNALKLIEYKNDCLLEIGRSIFFISCNNRYFIFEMDDTEQFIGYIQEMYLDEGKTLDDYDDFLCMKDSNIYYCVCLTYGLYNVIECNSNNDTEKIIKKVSDNIFISEIISVLISLT